MTRDWLSTSGLKTDVGGVSVRGGLWMSAAQGTKIIADFGSLALLARLLTPGDYGLLGMAVVFVGIPDLLKTGGLITVTIQRKELSAGEVTNIFWAGVAAAVLLAMAVCGLAPAAATFFHEPELVDVVMALALPVLLSGLSAQHLALLQRQMLFRHVAVINTIATLLSVLVAVFLALDGAGFWALIARRISFAALVLVGAWSSCTWRPSRPQRDVNILPLLRFGGAISLATLLNYVAKKGDRFLIGRAFGADSLGFYEQAARTLRLPIQQIRAPLQQIALPAMSALKGEPGARARYYRRYTELVAFVTMPLLTVAAVFSEELIGIVLGDQWLSVIPVFRNMAIFMIVDSVAASRGLVMLSAGKARRHLAWQFLYVLLTMLAIGLGLQHDIEAVTFYLVLVNVIALVPSLIFCFRGTGVSVGDFGRAVWMPASASAIIAPIGLMILPLFDSALVRLGLGVVACSLGYLLVWLAVPPMRTRLAEMSALLTSKLRKK